MMQFISRLISLLLSGVSQHEFTSPAFDFDITSIDLSTIIDHKPNAQHNNFRGNYNSTAPNQSLLLRKRGFELAYEHVLMTTAH